LILPPWRAESGQLQKAPAAGEILRTGPNSMKRRDTSITKVIILTLVSVTTVVLATFGSAYYGWERNRRISNLESRLAVTTAQLESSLALPLWNFDNEQVDKIIESTMRNQEVFGVTVTEVEGSGVISGFSRDAQ
jgi:two-component system cell cycle sensor histidine kinase/response regulator CckA